MGFASYATPYDWSRVASFKKAAANAPGGLIDLSIGSPVDPVPDSVRKALAAASNDPNAYGYPATVGTPELRGAIAQWFQDCRGVNLEQINADAVPTVGSKEAVALMASLLHLGEGDVVVQPQVAYPTYEIGTQISGARVVKVADVADTASWRGIPGVKAVWVNSPNNPTGETYGENELKAIVDAARAIGATVLSDECYAMMNWSDANAAAIISGTPLEGAPCALGANVCGGSADGILVLYSLSKQSNMAGYRAAFIAGDAALVGAMKADRKQIGQIVPGPVQAAMAAGLADHEALRTQFSRYRSRLLDLVGALRAYGYATDMPDGALYVWVKAKSGDCWSDMAALARIGIVPSPGEFYGDAGYLRFSATATDAAIAEAVQRLTNC